MKNQIFKLAIGFALLSLIGHASAVLDRITSPDGKVAVDFFQTTNGVPTYQVEYLNQPMILPSRLGLEPGFTNDLKPESVTTTQHSGTWTNLFGERRIVPDDYHELNVDLRCASGQVMRVTFRAYNEGAALRYSFPKLGTNEFNFTGESTEFRFPPGTFGYEEHGTEGEYHRTLISDVQPQCERPLTLEYADGLFAALGEADNENYPRMLLSPLAGVPGALASALGGTSSNTTRARDGMPDNPTAHLCAGDATPWRMLIVGQKPGDLLERNYLMLDLNPPCALDDVAWIKPGKVMRDMTLSTTNCEAIINFAAIAGLQYVELDWHWYGLDESFKTGDATTVRAPNLDLPKIIRYGQTNGVGVILYVDRKQIKKQRDTLFPLFEKWGIKGVKIGFVDVGPQTETAWITETIQKAAEYHLLLDIHDGYRPTGLARTYPNLLTVEGIRGNEHMPTSEHNCTLPFTRYIAGSADYTVCYYTDRKQTTFAHQLAMGVISFSPMQFIFWYDRPADYQGEAEIEFFRQIPTVWDETRVINGEIGKYAAIARRHGDQWFIGTINNAELRELKVPLRFLEPGRKYKAHVYYDDQSHVSRTSVAIETNEVNSQTIMKMPLLAAGGEAVWLVPSRNSSINEKSNLKENKKIVSGF